MDFIKKIYYNRFFPIILPTFLFLLYLLIMPNWFYNNIGWVDGWAYTGFFIDFKQLRMAMPWHPAGDLLPLTLVGHFFYAIFQPFWANFFFKSIRFILFGFMIFRMIEIEANRKTALLTTIISLTLVQTLMALQSDYTDGMVVLYLTATLFSISKAFEKTNSLKKTWMFLSGVFFSLSVFTAVLSIVNALSIVIFIIFKQIKENSTFKKIFQGLFFPILGFAFATGTLALVNYIYFGDVFFFANTIRKMFTFLSEVRGVHNLEDIIKDGGSLIFFFSALFIFLPCIFTIKQDKNKHFTGLIFYSMFGLSLFIYWFLQVFRNQETISNTYYINHLIPFLILTIAISLFSPLIDSLSNKNLLKVILVAALFGVTTFIKIKIYWLIFTIGMFLFFIAKNNKKELISLFVLFIFLATFGYFNSYENLVSLVWNKYRQNDVRIKLRDYIKVNDAWIKYVKIIDPRREKYLWYNASKNWYMRGLSASSHLWQLRLLNEEMPNLHGDVIDGVTVPLKNINNLILLSNNRNEADKGVSALKSIKFTCNDSVLIVDKKPIMLYVTECKR